MAYIIDVGWFLTKHVVARSQYLALCVCWMPRYQPAIAAGEWWRLFSSICIHGSFSHLFSNMLSLVILAAPLEQAYGPLRIFIIFIAAGNHGGRPLPSLQRPGTIHLLVHACSMIRP